MVNRFFAGFRFSDDAPHDLSAVMRAYAQYCCKDLRSLSPVLASTAALNFGDACADIVYKSLGCRDPISCMLDYDVYSATARLNQLTAEQRALVAPPLREVASCKLSELILRAAAALTARGHAAPCVSFPRPIPMHKDVKPGREFLDQQSDGVVDLLLSSFPDELFLVGGAPSRALLLDAHLCPAPGADFDFIVKAATGPQGSTAFVRVLEFIMLRLLNHSWHVSPFALTMVVANPIKHPMKYIKLQIMLKVFPDVLAVLNGFDYSSCMFAYAHVTGLFTAGTVPEFLTNTQGAQYQRTGIAVLNNPFNTTMDRFLKVKDRSGCMIMPQWMFVPEAPRPDHEEPGYDTPVMLANGSGCSFMQSHIKDLLLAILRCNRNKSTYLWAVDPDKTTAAVANRLQGLSINQHLATAALNLLTEHMDPAPQRRRLTRQAVRDCAACMAAPAIITLRPCMHTVLCRSCTIEWIFRRRAGCPICRAAVQAYTESRT